jgi:hypothetical protein
VGVHALLNNDGKRRQRRSLWKITRFHRPIGAGYDASA